MNPETLDRLLLDRALGALTPDACELLDAYLEREPDVAARGRQFAVATDLARQALVADRPAVLPPFPQQILRSADRTHRRLVMVRNVASLAACVLLGVGLGAHLLRTPQAARGPDHVAPPPEQTTVRAIGTDTSPGFWSVERLRNVARAPRPAAPAELEWDSPLSKPKLRGAT